MAPADPAGVTGDEQAKLKDLHITEGWRTQREGMSRPINKSTAQ